LFLRMMRKNSKENLYLREFSKFGLMQLKLY